jgi:hypothetical protein
MPGDMRERLKALLDEASRNAAAQGQPMDDRLLRMGIDKLEDVEKLLFGLADDVDSIVDDRQHLVGIVDPNQT